ncbi:MAG: phosphohydrolase [Anaerolineae bacterium]|nr:phosphohydrolase [Anaerolineae bacterium]
MSKTPRPPIASSPDWEGVRATLLERLARELPADLHYHGLHHTQDDVLPAAERLATQAGLDAEETLLLKTAALYHDAGFIFRYADNEVLASALAEQTLPQFGYRPEQVQVIQALIEATRMPQHPRGMLQELLCDADLDSLGREDFLETSHSLRREIEARGTFIPLQEWYMRQLEFLTTHRYFSAAARVLRDAGKQKNIVELQQRIQQF